MKTTALRIGLIGLMSLSAFPAQAEYAEQKSIPPLLGLQQGDKIKTTGLATGIMTFTKLSGSEMEISQNIVLTAIARTFIEKAMGKTLSSKSNTIMMRFEVHKDKKGGFEYQLFDRGNNQMLLEGPVKVLEGASNSAKQELEFKAPLVKMRVWLTKQAKGVDGKTKFYVGPIPVPGNMDFTHR